MNLPGFSIRRPIAVATFVVGILIVGFVSSGKLPLNLLPDITYPKVTIRTEYPHAAPAEVENMVTKPIEQTVGIITNVVQVSSVSRPGISEVTVEFTWGSDIDVITMDLREKLQLLEGVFPDEIKKPILLRYDPSTDPIVTLGVAGELSLAELRYTVEREVERELERIDGVAAVKVQGGEEEEIVVDVDEEKLSRYGLSLASVIERLRRENINLAGGTLEDAGEELSVRTMNEFQNLDDIRRIVVSSGGPVALSSGGVSLPSELGGFGGGGEMAAGMGSMLSGLGGLAGLILPGALLSGASSSSQTQTQISAPIRLGDIAQVERRPKERTEIARLNGKECIKVSVYKEGDANIVTVAKAVHQRLAQIKENLRAEPSSPEWLAGASSRKWRGAANAVLGVLLNVRPFSVPEESFHLLNRLDLKVISDQSVFIRQAIYSVLQSAIWGAMIACLVLYFFLRNISSTVIIGITIPISIIATFNLMYFQGLSFNIMSLGGLALGVGILVDNSIVILENILRHRTMNPDLKESASIGAREMLGAITAATLTNIIVFFPIFYVEGIFKQVFSDLAWTVTYSMIASELAAMTLIPMLAVVLGRRVSMPRRLLEDLDLPQEYRQGLDDEEQTLPPILQRPRISTRPVRDPDLPPPSLGSRLSGFLQHGANWLLLHLVWPFKIMGRAILRAIRGVLYFPLLVFDQGFKRIKEFYPRLLRRTLRRPWLTTLSVTSLAGVAVLAIYLLGWELIPNVDQGEFIINLRLPTGTPLAETNRRVSILESKIREIPQANYIQNLFSTVGVGASEGELESEKGENVGEITVAIGPPHLRPFSDEEFMDWVRQALAREVNLELRLSKPQLFSYKNPVELEISGYNLEDLRRASEDILARIQDVPGLADLESSIMETNPEIAITVDRERAAAFHLSVGEITDLIRKKVKGERASRFDRGDRQEDIVVETRLEDRATLADLGNLAVPLPGGGDVPLKAIADIRPTRGPGAVTRVGNSRVALIEGSLSRRALGDVVNGIEARLQDYKPARGIYWRVAGQNEEMKRSLGSLYLALALAIALVYLIMAMQFESLLQPFVIMFSVPFSVIGLTALLLLTGQTINVFTLIGILMMIGISVNDAIVMVTTINQFRAKGQERMQALLNAGAARLRPILITTLTTVLGMVPMAIVFGEGSELRAPMALAVIGGLLTSTSCTLLVIPPLYLIFDRFHSLLNSGPSAAPVPPPAPGE